LLISQETIDNNIHSDNNETGLQSLHRNRGTVLLHRGEQQMTSLEKQRVLVVGGSSGIGLAVAEQAAAEGAAVTIASRSADKLAEAARLIGGGVATAVLDTGDAGSVEAFLEASGAWDHIVISAAQTPSGPVRKLSLDDAKRAMESKFWGAYRIARAAQFAERGSLTFISGFLSERPSASSVLQGAINAALESLARGLALELSPVRVNAVSPGVIDTPLWSKMDEANRNAMFERIAGNLPAKTIGQPSDIANAVLFLMTTPFATGSTVRVDGGGAIG
jgi:NAD(P)-dependent dehydrogenase (short-subunit alcohol dehydrogenase family)